ncbi:hypothetical protein LOAG_10456 [Loa loa]|uniref:Uncharacterized protein n=1 Tax=Loa loa TaxID=7209 RepID=A0A1S0TPQ0_LOALO|nr:hypothetical protein LOAG_10456 [Loa loa]EFO18043.1 hypothetical protein LOAG_10456 [Loa loa]
MHIRINSHTYTRIVVYIHTHVNRRAQTHTRRDAYARTCLYMHKHMDSYTQTRIHTIHTRVQAQTYTRVHTYTHTRMHAYTHKCIETHMHRRMHAYVKVCKIYTYTKYRKHDREKQ